MRENYVFHVFDSQLEAFLALVDKCPVDKRRIVPEGFETNLHWHVGHVLTVTVFHVFGLADLPEALPDLYHALFAYRSKVSDWKEEPPEWEVLITQLKEQRNRIHDMLQGNLEDRVNENFLKAENLGELVIATSAHLATHIGVVSAMLQLVRE